MLGDFFPFGLDGREEVFSPMPAPHRHFEFELFILEETPYQRLHSGEIRSFAPGNPLLFWGAFPHKLYATDRLSKGFIAHIPIHLFLGWGLPDPLVHQLMNGRIAEIPENDEVTLATKTLRHYLVKHSEQTQKPFSKATLLNIEAQFHILAERSVARMPRSQRLSINGASQGDRVSAMIRYLTGHIHEKISIQSLAQALNIHPVYALRLFKKTTGMTIVEFLTSLRLQKAASELIHTPRTVLDIALECGFPSMSHFHEQFKRHFHTSPHAYRKTYTAVA